MDQGSMDPFFGPGPWTTFMDRVHGPPVMDQVHGQFFLIFIRSFCIRSMDTQKQKKCLKKISRDTVNQCT